MSAVIAGSINAIRGGRAACGALFLRGVRSSIRGGLVALLLFAAPGWAADRTVADEVYLFPYFTGNGEDGVKFAWSDDGREFHNLASGMPLMTPPSWPDQNLTRDPSIVYRDGIFRMVWTSHWKGEVFGYAESADLLHWSRPLQVRPFAGGEHPLNVWAPELHFDAARGDWMVVFSSTLPEELHDGDGSEDAHHYDHRLYVLRTRDFKTFTAAVPYFDPGHSVIDGQIADASDGHSWLVYKNEMPVEKGGKNLRLTELPDRTGVAINAGPAIIGPGSDVRPDEQAEGPTLLWNGSQWLLYWDAFSSGHYGLASSPDLKHWTDESDRLRFPVEHPRHGTVFMVPREVFQRIQALSGS